LDREGGAKRGKIAEKLVDDFVLGGRGTRGCRGRGVRGSKSWRRALNFGEFWSRCMMGVRWCIQKI